MAPPHGAETPATPTAQRHLSARLTSDRRQRRQGCRRSALGHQRHGRCRRPPAPHTCGRCARDAAFTGPAQAATLPTRTAGRLATHPHQRLKAPITSYAAAGTYTATLPSLTAAPGPRRRRRRWWSHRAWLQPLRRAPPVCRSDDGQLHRAQARSGPFTYAWTFGDGAISTAQNPSHTYSAAGAYTVNLSVTDANHSPSRRLRSRSRSSSFDGDGISGTKSGRRPGGSDLHGSAAGGTPPYTYAWTSVTARARRARTQPHYSAAGTYTVNLNSDRRRHSHGRGDGAHDHRQPGAQRQPTLPAPAPATAVVCQLHEHARRWPRTLYLRLDICDAASRTAQNPATPTTGAASTAPT